MKIAKHLSTALTIVILASMAVACAQNEPSPSGAAATDSNLSDQVETIEQEALYPRTITDFKNNRVLLKEEPKRVAVTDYVIFSHLVSLDYYPMAANMYHSYISIMESMKQTLSGHKIEDIGEWDAINLEKTASLDPDLILSSTSDADKVYEHLNTIAPVIFYDPAKMGNSETDWKWGLREVASVIAREDQAEQVIQSTEQLLAEKKEALAAYQDKTVAFFFYSKGRGGFTSQAYSALSVYYELLGLTPAFHNEGVETITLEGLVEVNPDYIFIFDTDGTTAKELAEMEHDKVWQQLNAVKNNHVFLANFSMAIMSPINIKYGAEVIDKALNG
ncbi:hypothetical protein PA598K_00053 [Paenibacillus sp. 598K]|uniref:ABC transporter substrate-binding protein n=1 Tax=Paenibacillus sp. 598K TaxID=1117987 RepID=UPI000FF9738A|nr:ABC transporter substrate-binding protein [Paenibacillus sp. 598K]GBF71840.1 hypothetical protein PA598K_00053 [Paenibacillus sp. 598K]